jgi:hypothetical protein
MLVVVQQSNERATIMPPTFMAFCLAAAARERHMSIFVFILFVGTHEEHVPGS